MPDVLVIGAGPAGLHAALAAAEHDADVTLLDATDDLGGQFWRHPPAERAAVRRELMQHNWKSFQQLRVRLQAHPRCRILTSTEVWAIEPGAAGAAARVHALTGPSGAAHRDEVLLAPDRLVLATGAHDP